ncbi:HutD family protein [Nocardioides sp. NBC_00368]|uniref:HutD/Ves family protein n=1 Tax=Nocardioides sp. NBC_00368 TaxID=2976000 RepID=UPI002E1A8EC2
MNAVLDPAAVAPVPWDNGAGFTRELAVAHGPDGKVLWRVSVADLVHDAEFSRFPDLDRLFVALGPLVLSIGGHPTTMGAGDAIRFAGEAEVTVRPDRPTRALNVMTRRDAVRADVHLGDHGEPAHPGVSLRIDVGDRVAEVHLETVLPNHTDQPTRPTEGPR